MSPSGRVVRVGVWTVGEGKGGDWVEMLLPPKEAFQSCLLPAALLAAAAHPHLIFPALIPLHAAQINTSRALDLHRASNTWRQLHLSAALCTTVTRRKPVGACPQRLQCSQGSGAALALSWFGLSLGPEQL